MEDEREDGGCENDTMQEQQKGNVRKTLDLATTKRHRKRHQESGYTDGGKDVEEELEKEGRQGEIRRYVHNA